MKDWKAEHDKVKGELKAVMAERDRLLDLESSRRRKMEDRAEETRDFLRSIMQDMIGY